MRAPKISQSRRAAEARPDYHVEPGAPSAGTCAHCGRPYRASPSAFAGQTVQRYGSAVCQYDARLHREAERRERLPARDLAAT